MNKAQAVALLLTGAAAGVGGREAVGALVSPAEAKALTPFVHAADLRRDIRTPERLGVLAYGSQQAQPDAGVVDMGQAKQCVLKPATQKKAAELLTALGADCVWER